MEEKFITRERALEVIWELINSNILDKKIDNDLQAIAFCIEQEQYGYHCWGADDDICNLHVAYRSDLITDELKAELQGISDKYSFVPAPYEQAYFEEDEYEDEEE